LLGTGKLKYFMGIVTISTCCICPKFSESVMISDIAGRHFLTGSVGYHLRQSLSVRYINNLPFVDEDLALNVIAVSNCYILGCEEHWNACYVILALKKHDWCIEVRWAWCRQFWCEDSCHPIFGTKIGCHTIPFLCVRIEEHSAVNILIFFRYDIEINGYVYRSLHQQEWGSWWQWKYLVEHLCWITIVHQWSWN